MCIPIMIPPSTWSLCDRLALQSLRVLSIEQMLLATASTENLESCLYHPPAALLRILQPGLFHRWNVTELRDSAQVQLELCRRNNVRVVAQDDHEYPALLRTIPYAPFLLFVQGTLPDATTPTVAIVGTRRCTSYGAMVTREFAQTLSHAGACVVSGLANGIDTIAHEEALKGKGNTVAVIASGCDKVSPGQAEHLAARIVDAGGAIVSEYRCGTRALPPYFPQRNRIISGLSTSVVVVESGLRGGSLITADFAREHQRRLLSVPGNITSERSAGTNRLIQEGLALAVLDARHLLDICALHAPAHSSGPLPEFSSHEEEQIYHSLSREALHVDAIAEGLDQSVSALLVHLLSLEFKGLVQQLPGKFFVQARP